MNAVLVLTAAGLRAIRVARVRGRRHGDSCDCVILAACRADDFQTASDRRMRLTAQRLARGGLN